MAAIAQRAVLYIRVSTPQQERGYSPAFQEKHGRELADREHLHIFEVVYEQVSGTKEHRDGIERVHEILETPEAGNIITYAVDRLGRGGWEAAYYAQRWLKAGARIWDSKSQRERCTTDEDLLLVGIESVFAGNEHRKITSRVRDGLQERQEQGHPNPHVPYGYVYVRDYNNPADKGTAGPLDVSPVSRRMELPEDCRRADPAGDSPTALERSAATLACKCLDQGESGVVAPPRCLPWYE
jgi:DNA invertase Pin-like site-specific DNA recombinase